MATTDPALGLKRAPKGVYKVRAGGHAAALDCGCTTVGARARLELELQSPPAGRPQVQLAPSGRSACQACQGLIPYGELRLGLLIEKEGYTDW